MPRTPAEWQKVVNLAAAWRMVWDCILEEAESRGVRPNVNVAEYAAGLIAAHNAERQEQ